MKIKKNLDNGEIYAVGIATGKSADGRDYQNILVSAEKKPALRSDFSYFLDVNDEDMMQSLGITDIQDYRSADGTRKVTKLNPPVSLGTGTLATVEHAPYGMRRVDDPTKYRMFHSTTVVCMGSDSVESAASRAITRAYERADAFDRKLLQSDDYRKYITFATDRDTFIAMLEEQDLGE